MDHTTIKKDFFKYIFFSTLGTVGISLYILADTYFVSLGMGTNGLTALNLAIPVYNLIHGTGLMLGMGGATKYAIYKSQGETVRANLLYTNTLLLSIVFSVIFMIAGLLGAEHLTRILGADDSVFDMTNTYLTVLMLFSPAFILNDVLICFVRNDGNPRLSMFAMLGGSMFNIVMDYFFIFPCGMGILGAVLATGLSPLVGIAILIPHWRTEKRGFFIAKSRFRQPLVTPIFLLGVPSFVAQLSSAIVMITFNGILLNLQGNTAVAAYGVIANISLVVVGIYTGIAQGIQPMISGLWGGGNRREADQIFRHAIVIVLVISIALYLFLFFAADTVAAAFNSERNLLLQETAVHGLRIYFISAAFVGFNTVLSTYFTSVERALPAHILSLLRGLFLIIPIAFLLSAVWGVTGVWLAFPVTESLTAALGIAVYVRKQGQQTVR